MLASKWSQDSREVVPDLVLVRVFAANRCCCWETRRPVLREGCMSVVSRMTSQSSAAGARHTAFYASGPGTCMAIRYTGRPLLLDMGTITDYGVETTTSAPPVMCCRSPSVWLSANLLLILDMRYSSY